MRRESASQIFARPRRNGAHSARSAKAAARYADLAVIVDALETEAGCTSPRGKALTRTHVLRIRQAAAVAATREPRPP